MRELTFAAVVGLLALLGTVTPAALSGQETRVDTAGIDEARLTAYAKAFIAISAARDSVGTELVLPRNKKPEVQLELREKLREHVARVLREHHLTQDEYNRITYAVSSDARQRQAFDGIMARLVPRQAPR